jgi:hypothetical protein
MRALQPEHRVSRAVDMTDEPLRRRRLEALLELLPSNDAVLDQAASLVEARLVQLSQLQATAG